MRDALPKDDPAYGTVKEIDGRLYVGGAGPEAMKAKEREAARERQKAQQAERAEAERARVEAMTERYGPMIDAWPAVRAELTRRQREAEERLRVALLESPVFGELIEVLAVAKASFLGSQSVGAARAEITGRPFVGGTPPKRLDVLELVRELGEGAARDVLADAREQVARPVGD